MKKLKPVVLPGSDRQFEAITGKIDISGQNVLIMGTGAEEIAVAFAEWNNNVFIIVEEQENLVLSRYLLSENKNISARMMDFDNTDFQAEKFDIVYAQASVSGKKRNKIVKEVKRILKPAGIFCVGEIVNKTGEVPPFISDVWNQAGLLPLLFDEIGTYYKDKGFDIIKEEDLSSTLTYFYEKSSSRLKDGIEKLSEHERSFHKKLLKQISHESNVYLKLGGDVYIGFKMLILRKG